MDRMAGTIQTSHSIVIVIITIIIISSSSSSSGYSCRDKSRWPCDTLYPQKLALISPTSGGRSVGIVYSRTQATEFCSSSSSSDCGSGIGIGGSCFYSFRLHSN
jgi:hypothetical protein